MSRYLLKELEDKFNELEIQQEEDELDEANVTANLDGGAGPPRTPYAFAKSEDDMDDDHIEVLGYKKSKKSNKHFESISKIDSQLENLIEAITLSKCREIVYCETNISLFSIFYSNFKIKKIHINNGFKSSINFFRIFFSRFIIGFIIHKSILF